MQYASEAENLYRLCWLPSCLEPDKKGVNQMKEYWSSEGSSFVIGSIPIGAGTMV